MIEMSRNFGFLIRLNVRICPKIALSNSIMYIPAEDHGGIEFEDRVKFFP
jgi:hypothetical protein